LDDDQDEDFVPDLPVGLVTMPSNGSITPNSVSNNNNGILITSRSYANRSLLTSGTITPLEDEDNINNGMPRRLGKKVRFSCLDASLSEEDEKISTKKKYMMLEK